MARIGSLIRGTGIATIAAFVLTACGGGGYNQEATTKVLQSVSVNLDSDAAITEVGGSAVYLDETSGESDSSENSFEVEDVVDDLPVRVTTQYETDEDSGTNLEDLEGHNGRVKIDVTLENLTLTSSDLTYDVAGEARESPALVGTPLSVAGSVELAGIQASEVVSDPESESSTNGVVSQTSEGDAVVQWGTVLAPPQSEATTTFELVADVDDFDVPDIDIAVQAGFHTDMSFEGQVASAFDTGENSEYARQQNAIELVADVNDVLTRAGTTITDIRTTLDHTTETLGVDAAEQLSQNSDDMVAEMERVGEQLTALESQVEGSLTGAENSMNSQLSQIVSSMNGMMGNTDANPPQLLQGEGCAATAEDAESNNSLYSTFLVLGAQLDAYAQGNTECRDEIVQEIENTLGPETPDAETCDTSNGADVSITCALFSAQNSVLTSLNDLVETGEQLIVELSTQDVSKAAGHNDEVGGSLESIDGKVDEIFNPSEEDDGASDDNGDEGENESPEDDESDPEPSEEPTPDEEETVTWESLIDDVGAARAALASLQDQLTPIRDDALKDVDEHVASVKEDFSDIGDETDEIRKRHEDLAEEVCAIDIAEEDGPQSSRPGDDEETEPEPSDLDKLSTQLVGVDCEGNPPADSEDEPAPSLADRLDDVVDEAYEDELDAFAEGQEAHWQTAVDELDVRNEDSAIFTLDASLQQIEEDFEELEGLVEEEIEAIDNDADERIRDAQQEAEDRIREILTETGAEEDRIKGLVGSIQQATSDAERDQEKVKSALEDLQVYEDKLPEDIRAAFQKVVDETAEELPENIDEQVRVVSDRVNSARDSVVASYNSTIAGLATTSDAVINDTGEQIEEQQATLETQQDETTSALSESTTAVIEGIHQSTTSSTRDLEGASAQLSDSLNNVILDLGDPDVQGSGILGSMSSSSALSDTADYQLALASQRAAGYANVRSEDIAEIMLRQAQFSASLEAAATLPAFHLDVPSGARSQTIYSFTVSGGDA